ncbi:hypothetical protein FHL15_002619 [Xylaria flabelliformis]|uniref:L-tryptophan decarboxylase PsiD-like domain-containing protein n=1 Tax=Xylaria flabelliformis TaxID=2512241 RepID=A0A553I817_9PEZI|nr:hypothetical protein FHL15_002619 [Xylaria flabelliformis]
MATQPTIPYRQGHFNRIGGWLPNDPRVHIEWTRKLIAEMKEKRQFRGARANDRADSIQDFDRVVKSNARFRMLASAMLDEVPNKEPYLTDPVGTATIRYYEELLDAFDFIVKNKAPQWSMSEYKGGLIGFPFNAILDWPMATPSGYAFFLEPQINEKLKAILNTWRHDVLSTGKSLYVITTESNGWLSEQALKAIEDDTNIDGQNLKFTELFKCDPVNDPAHWGFRSWDDFFVRTFKDINTLRPVQFSTDPKWIVNSCESKPFSRQANVKEYDNFWLKGQPYSVAEMLNYEPQYTSKFVGGTVYQAFLSATSYHRWNSPVKGDIVYATVIDGTYFSEPTITGFSNPDGPDVAAPDLAQGYICHVATRAIFIIDTKDPVVGLIGAVYVGMADVSTCEISEKFQGGLPVAVEKGEEIGMFHHGGSTHCLLFEKKVKLAWVTEASPETATRNLPIRSALAYAYGSA